MILEPARRARRERWRSHRQDTTDGWTLWIAVPVAIAGGALTSLGFPASDLSPLALLGVAAGLAAMGGAGTARRGALIGFIYGLAFTGIVFSWTLELEVVAYLALAPAQAAFWAITGAGVAAARRVGPLGWTVAAAATWTLVEALRARQPLGGFEWGQLGLTAAELPVRSAAAVVGTLGLTGLLVAVAAGVVALVRERDRGWVRASVPLLLAVAATAGVGLLGTQDWTEPAGELEVGIVQMDPPCPGEYAVDCPGLRETTLTRHIEGTDELDGDVDLLLWGEGTLRGASPMDAGADLHTRMGELPAPLLTGVTSPEGEGRFYNRNVLLDTDGTVVDAYAKQHPVPFGEYVPLRPLLGWVGDVGRLVPSDMVRGTTPGLHEVPRGEAELGSAVSWEVTFARLVRDTARGSDAVVTLTTQVSYGQAPVSDQLLQAAQLRAAETGRAMAVAAATGRSTVIAPGGEVGEVTALFAGDTMTTTMELREGATPFLRYGEWPVIGVAAVLALVIALVARARAQRLV